MEKVIFLIDGFNLYHAIMENNKFNKYRWINLSALAEKFITKNDRIVDIYYFTALATWSVDKVKRHKVFIKAQELYGIKIVYGEFRKRDKKCNICKKTYQTFEEKKTDVNIAISLFQLAIKDEYDKAIIISGDSDLIPSIEAVKSTFPSKQIGVIIPIGRRAELLKNTCDFYMKMKEKHLSASMLPDQIDIGKGKKIVRPNSWN
ncbi:MAG: NYN domain-containing protein [Desulfobacteraceae bacterium]|jgi:uncharacterized LabA/DUF88 family protein